MKNFFRKVAFGIGPHENLPSDPLKWAIDQVIDVPKLSWQGKILSEIQELIFCFYFSIYAIALSKNKDNNQIL